MIHICTYGVLLHDVMILANHMCIGSYSTSIHLLFLCGLSWIHRYISMTTLHFSFFINHIHSINHTCTWKKLCDGTAHVWNINDLPSLILLLFNHKSYICARDHVLPLYSNNRLMLPNMRLCDHMQFLAP